jgi:hypothetical protein
VFKITIKAVDTAGTLSNLIQLFLKNLRLRGLISKAVYIIEEENNE